MPAATGRRSLRFRSEFVTADVSYSSHRAEGICFYATIGYLHFLRRPVRRKLLVETLQSNFFLKIEEKTRGCERMISHRSPLFLILFVVVISTFCRLSYGQNDVCTTIRIPPHGGACEDPGDSCKGGSGHCAFSPSTGCICVPNPKPAYLLFGSPLSVGSVSPGTPASPTSTITAVPVAGYTGTVTLSCSITGGGPPTPTCGVAPSTVTLSGRAASVVLTVTSTSQTSIGSYNVVVSARDQNNQTPRNGAVVLIFNVGDNGIPITYTERVSSPGVVLQGCDTNFSGSVGGQPFGGPNTTMTITFTMTSNTGNVVPFAVPGTHGFENTSGNVSFVLQDWNKEGATIAQGTFLPAAGMFVSVDNINQGVGFGSFGALPQSAQFQNIQPVYPFALAAEVTPGIQTYNLATNFTENPGAYFAMSCTNFPNTCGAPLPLPTTAGDLIINTADICGWMGSFSAATATYTLSASPTNPNSIASGQSSSSTVTLSSPNGDNSTVQLSCSVSGGGAPPPMCSFSPASLSGGSGSSTLTVSTASQTPQGNYTITVSGADIVGQGPINAPVTTTLTVSNTVIGGIGGGGDIALATFAGLFALWAIWQLRRKSGAHR